MESLEITETNGLYFEIRERKTSGLPPPVVLPFAAARASKLEGRKRLRFRCCLRLAAKYECEAEESAAAHEERPGLGRG